MTAKISILLPIYNEAEKIGAVLESIANQTYPRECIEVVIAQAASTDGTGDTVRQFCAEHPELAFRCVDNPSGNTAAGRNLCLAAASGQLVMNYSGHAVAESNLLEVLATKLGQLPDDVAGIGCAIRMPEATTALGRAITVAMFSPMGGVGQVDSAMCSGTDRVARSVAFTLYRREVLDQLGGFDEAFWCGQDAELNLRLARHGYKLWFTPETAVHHFKRSRLGDFVAQIFRYGVARAKLTRKFPRSLRAVFLLPTLFTLATTAAVAGSLLNGTIAIVSLVAVAAFVLLSTMSASLAGGDAMSVLLSPFLYFIMYTFYGIGFVRGLLPYRFRPG